MCRVARNWQPTTWASTRWDRWSPRLEVTVGELLPDQPVPLLKRRLELSRDEALKLWVSQRKEGWQMTVPQWQPPLIPNAERQSGPDGRVT